MMRGREGRATIGDSVLFYDSNAAVVPQGELGDPSRTIEAIHLKQLSSRHQVKLLHVKNIYAYICAHPYLQMDNTKKYTHKIGRKHGTPSEKKKGTPKMFQRLCFSPLCSKKSQPKVYLEEPCVTQPPPQINSSRESVPESVDTETQLLLQW